MLFKNLNGRIEYLMGRDFESVRREIINFLGWEVFFIINVYFILWIGVYGIKYILNECVFLIRFENEIFVFGMLRIIWVVNF